MAELLGRRPPRPAAPTVLQVSPPKWKKSRSADRQIIRVQMQEPPDIPESVAILFQASPSQAPGSCPEAP